MSDPSGTGRDRSVTPTPPRALAAVSLALVLFTVNALFVRQAGDDVAGFATWRMFWSLPLLLPLALTMGGRADRAGRDRRAPLGGRVIAMSLGAGVLFATSALVTFSAINQTTLVTVGVINALQPAVVTVVAGRWLGERVDLGLAARAALAIGGAVLVALGATAEGSWSLRGDVLAVISLFLNSGWFLVGRTVRSRTHVDATTFMLLVFTGATVTAAAYTAAAGLTLAVPASLVGFAAATALFGTTGHTLIAWAHRYVAASVSSLLFLTQPVLIGLLAWVAFGEALGVLQIAGAAIVLGALSGIVMRTTREAPPTATGALPDTRDDPL